MIEFLSFGANPPHPHFRIPKFAFIWSEEFYYHVHIYKTGYQLWRNERVHVSNNNQNISIVGLTLTGVKLAPRGDFCPLEVKEWVNIPPRGQSSHLGLNLPLGAYFTPGNIKILLKIEGHS
jgi:hypothetical protein